MGRGGEGGQSTLNFGRCQFLGGEGGEGGRSTLTLKSEVEIYLADPGWIDTDPGGVD